MLHILLAAHKKKKKAATKVSIQWNRFNMGKKRQLPANSREFYNDTTCRKKKLPDKFEDINGLHANYVSCRAHTLCLQQNSLGDSVHRAQAEAGQDNPTTGEPLKNAHGASHATCVWGPEGL